VRRSQREEEPAADHTATTRAPLRVMQVLAELAKSPDGVALARLSERLRVPKTSLFSLLRALEAGGFVESRNGQHRLGYAAFNLALTINRQNDFTPRLRPALHWLQQQCGETVMFGVPAPDWSCLVLAEVIEAMNMLRFTAHVGAERKLYSTSIGLALLAHATPDQQDHYIATTELPRHTPTTLTSPAALRRTLQRTRRDGYVVNSGSVLGATAVGAPVFDANGRVSASFSVAGPTARIEQRSLEIIGLALEAGRRMSKLLGYEKSYPKSSEPAPSNDQGRSRSRDGLVH
jgi:IclR family KDG regulon transcriptional repressor